MCVGLRYTQTERDLFSSTQTRVSRNGMVPSFRRRSSVNWRYVGEENSTFGFLNDHKRVIDISEPKPQDGTCVRSDGLGFEILPRDQPDYIAT